MNRLIRFLFTQVLIAMVQSVSGQSVAGSSIVTDTYISADGTKKLRQCVFDNGLGDIVEEVQVGITPQGNDLTVYHDYDGFRRKIATWLPVVSQEGDKYINRKNLILDAQKQYSDANPYTRTVYDKFLFNEPCKLYQSGYEWQNSDKKTDKSYSLSGALYMEVFDGEFLACWEYPVLNTTSVDEDGRKASIYKDELNRIVVKANSDGETYYVYDNKGQICYVVPPILTNIISQNMGSKNYIFMSEKDENVQKYAYIYHYDEQGHCIYKKLPGCEPVFYIYDKTGNCVLSQNGNQRAHGQWEFKIPDKFGRTCITGICKNTLAYELYPLHSMYVYADYNGSTLWSKGYEVHNLELRNPILYTAIYYDDYSFIGSCNIPNSLQADVAQTVDSKIHKGLKTGMVTACIADSGVTGYLCSAIYYDLHYRVGQIKSTNLLGGVDKQVMDYTFTGKILKKQYSHSRLGFDAISENQEYVYDNAERLTAMSHKLDDSREHILVSNQYDELGRLCQLTKGSLPPTSYTYNIHSAVTSISNPLFSEKLYYNESHGGNTPQYGGNISAMEWKVNFGNVSDALRGYNYTYDNLSRLLKADYIENGTPSEHYGTSYTYDAMGNILSLHRNGLHNNNTFDEIDNLTYTYEGNQLIKVDDAAQDPIYKDCFDFRDGADEDIEYEYDANGNMTKDLNHGICNIEYNCINLPSRVEFLDGSKVLYTYDANGTKLRTDYYINPMSAVVPQAANEQGASSAMNLRHTWTDYCGNFIYENDTLKQTLIEGGYISYEYPQNTAVTSISQLAPTYHFYVQDHLGNNRLVVDEKGTIEQVNHYYPYGGLMGESKNLSSNQRYKYNGKEFDRMHGLDWYDYGARFHDPATGRWFSVDQLAEKYKGISPYVYCANDPVKHIDPDGMEVKPGDFFLTLDEAAKDFGIYINAISIKENREYATSFYTMVSSDGKKGFSYTEPIKGSEAGAVAKTNISRDAKGNVTATNKTTKEKAVATAHTHGSYNKDYGIGNDVFSGLKELIGQDKAEERKNLNDKTKDIGSSNSSRLQDYLVTPNGTLQNYNPSTGIIRIVSENMPKDEKDNKTLKDIKDYYGQK